MFKDGDITNNNNNNNELIFKITKTNKPEIYELYLKSTDTNVKIGYCYVKNIKMSNYLNNLFINSDSNVNVLCKYNTYFKKWEPLKHTTDLISHINDYKTLNLNN